MIRRRETVLSFLLFGIIQSVFGQTGQCLGSFDSITLRENEFVSDYNVTRVYVLCSNSVINVGRLDFSNNFIPGSGQDFMPARPNLHIKCGLDGSRSNNCIVTGGDIQIDATGYLGNSMNPTNVRFEGITFGASSRYTLWATQPGDITFVNCVFRDNLRALAPVYLDYFDADKPNTFVTVSFERCSFISNRYFGEGANPAIVTANGNQNRLNFDRCQFSDNDFIFNNTKMERSSFLVETSGPISVKRSCFENNIIGVSSIAAYGTEVTAELNYGSFSNGQLCQFISSFESSLQFQLFLPRCYSFDSADVCLSSGTSSPSVSPSTPPSLVPSLLPTPLPTTGLPTSVPTMLPSLSPSETPTTAPSTPHPTTTTGFPSKSPSAVPTTTSSVTPSIRPISGPTLAPVTSAPVTSAPVPGAPPVPVPNPGTGGGTSSAMGIFSWASSLFVACLALLMV